jgi:hypothetical protein
VLAAVLQLLLLAIVIAGLFVTLLHLLVLKPSSAAPQLPAQLLSSSWLPSAVPNTADRRPVSVRSSEASTVC